MAVIEEHSEGVGTVSLNRPGALNAMDTATYGEVTAALRRIEADPEVRVGIVTGNGSGVSRRSSASTTWRGSGPSAADSVFRACWRQGRPSVGITTT